MSGERSFAVAVALVLLAAAPARADGEAPKPVLSLPKPVLSLKEIRERGVVRQKWDLSCGAAALATLLTFQHDDPVPEVDIAKAMLRKTDPLRVKVRLGFSLLDLKTFVDGRGYEGIGYGGMSFDDLEAEAPAIVPLNTDSLSHFVVYRGHIDDRVVLADPAFGNRTMSIARFLSLWELKVAFVVVGRDGKKPPGRMAPRPEDIVTVSDMAIRNAIR